MRILVTGASGFVGRHVLRDLQRRGVNVVAVSRQARNGTDGTQWAVLDDPGNAAAVRRLLESTAPDVVIHLAGISSASDLGALYAANVVFAGHLLEAALSMGLPPRVLVAGSAAEYGPVEPVALPVTEHQICRPNTAYGISKLAQTGHALLARSRGLRVTVARVFNPIGPGMPSTLALGSFAEQIARMGPGGGVLHTGDLEVVRDFMGVAQTAEHLVDLAITHAGTVGLINVCTGKGHSLGALTQTLIELSGLPVTVRHEAARRGNSNVRAFVGCADRLRGLGYEPTAADHELKEVLGRLLEETRTYVAP